MKFINNNKMVVTGNEGNTMECALLQLIDELVFLYSYIHSQTRGQSDVGELALFLGEGKQFDFKASRTHVGGSAVAAKI
jgi:hypothetical protein